MQKSRDTAGNRITQAYQAAMPQPSNLTNAPIITTNTTYTYLQVGTDNFLASANLTTGWWKTGSNKLQEVTETSKFNYDDQARRQLEDRYDQYYYDSNSAHTNYGNVSGNYSGSSYSQSETAAVKLYDGEGAVRAYQGVYNTLGGNTGNLSTVSEDWVRGSDWGGGIGGILYSQALSGNANTAKYYHYDGRGDVVALTSNTGAVTYQAAYDAYGTHGNVSTKGTEESGTDTDPFRTNTREEWLSADGTTFVNERHRPRDLLTDVYFTRDPLGQAAGPNPYTYVEQDEWTKFDPEGLINETFGGDNWFMNNIMPDPVAEFHAGQASAAQMAGGSNGFEKAGGALGTMGHGIMVVAAMIPGEGMLDKGILHVGEEVIAKDVAKDGAADAAKATAENQATKDAAAKATVSSSAQADASKAADKVHGNSLDSTKPQHTYDIHDVSDPDNPKLYKTGVSGQELNANETSPRANQQVNKLNEAAGSKKYKATVTETDIPGRKAALEKEQARVNEHAAANGGAGPPGNKLPQPQTPPTPGN